MQHIREGKNFTLPEGQAKERAEKESEEKLQKMLDANADILQVKKEMMELGDFERIQYIDDEIEKVDGEIKNKMKDTNNLNFDERIEMEKQKDKLRQERRFLENKYKGMSGI